MKKKFLCLLLSTMMVTSLAGCSLFSEDTPEEPDTTIRISVTKDMLISSQEEEVEAKSIDELYTIGETVVYGDMMFTELIPGSKLAAEGQTKMLCKFKDANYAKALYDSKDNIYIDVATTSVPAQRTNIIYSAVFTDLSSMSYDDMFAKIITDTQSGDDVNIIPDETVPEDTADEALVETEEEITEEAITEEADDSLTKDSEAITEEATDDGLEEAVEEITEELAVEDEPEVENEGEGESIMDLFSSYMIAKDAGKVYYSESDLHNIISAYFEQMNFVQGSDIVVYSKDGERLGEYTSSQLQAYIDNVNGVPTDYTLISGYAKLSDLLPGGVYKTTALDNGNGAFTIHVKNDTGLPARLRIWTADTDSTAVPENAYDVPFLTDSFKITGYYPENEWANSSTKTTYYFTFDKYDTNYDLANEYAALDTTLKLSTVSPDDKGKYSFDSNYNIVINDTGKTVIITSNSKEEETLKPDTVIGIHPEMYRNFKFEFVEEEVAE